MLHHGPPLRRRPAFLLAMAAVVACWGNPARAVILYGPPGRDTSAPSDPALAIRWNQVGDWGGYLGTPIAANFFLTAKHVGGTVGGSITFLDGTSYQTVARIDDPASDLSLWQISGSFDSAKIVPLYTDSTVAANAPLVIFGRGTARGDAVFGDAFGGGTEQKGWLWGTGDGARSWGTNSLDGVTTIPGAGLQLVFSFSSDQGSTEGTLSVGDSAGPVFIQQGGIWSLAGINYAVEGPYNTTDSGDGFFAALYDVGGLYETDGAGGWTYAAPQATPQPSDAVSTSTTARLAWIDGTVTAVPEPGSLALLGVAVLCWPLYRGLLRGRSHGASRPVTSAGSRRTTPARPRT
jgi:hypothetical protein